MDNEQCGCCKKYKPDIFRCVCGYDFCLYCKEIERHDGGVTECDKCHQQVCNSFIMDISRCEGYPTICFTCEVSTLLLDIQTGFNSISDDVVQHPNQ